MSKPRYDWWPYVKGMIRRYPDLHLQYLAMREPTITPRYDATPGSGLPSDSTASTALKALSPINQREHDAVDAAISTLHQTAEGEERLHMVKMIFFLRTHTIEGASQELHRSWRTVAEWHRDFIRDVARNFGLLEK